MSGSLAETGECSLPSRKLFAGLKIHVFKPSFEGHEGSQLVDLIRTNGAQTAAKPHFPEVSIVIVGLPPTFPRDLILCLNPRDKRQDTGIRVGGRVLDLIWKCGIVLGEEPPKVEQRRHIVRPEWVRECLRQRELLLQDRNYGGWDIRGSYDPRDISRLPLPSSPPTNPFPRVPDTEDQRPLPPDQIAGRGEHTTPQNSVPTSETEDRSEPPSLRPIPEVDKPSQQMSACYVPRYRSASTDLPVPPHPPPSVDLKRVCTPSDRPNITKSSETTAILNGSLQMPPKLDAGLADTCQPLLLPSRSLGCPLYSGRSPSRIGATPPTKPRMHRPPVDEKTGSKELESEQIEKMTTSMTADPSHDNSVTTSHGSIRSPGLFGSAATTTKATATIDDFFKDPRRIAPIKNSWQQDNILIHRSSGFDKTRNDEAPIKPLDIPSPIIATGQGGAFVTSPVAISPGNGSAQEATSRFATMGYYRAMDPRIKRQDHQTEIEEMEFATVPVGASKCDSVPKQSIKTEDLEQGDKIVLAGVDAGLGIQVTPDSRENEIIDLTDSQPSRTVKSKLAPIFLEPPPRAFKASLRALEPASFTARGSSPGPTVQTERSQPQETSLGRKGRVTPTPFLPTPKVEPLGDPLLCQAAATRRLPTKASSVCPSSHAEFQATRAVIQPQTGKIFHPSGLLPSSFYLAVPEPYKTSLEILITSFGGGCITTADCATYIILSHAGSVGGSALSPGEEQLVNMVEHDPSRAVLSQEWVNACIRAEKLVGLESYRIVAGSVGAMSSGGPTATIERLTRPIRQPESLGVTRGVHGVGRGVHNEEVSFDGIAEEVKAPKVKATNQARHDEEAKAHYQHFEDDEETWDDPAFLEELQAIAEADQDHGSDFEMRTSEVMSGDESESLGDEHESGGLMEDGSHVEGYSAPRECKAVGAKDREVYDWMVRSLKACDRVGSRKQFLNDLSTRCPFGRSCNSTFIRYRSHFERDVPGLKALARPRIRRPRSQRRGMAHRAKISGGVAETRKVKPVGGTQAQAQAEAEAERNAASKGNKRGVPGVGVDVVKDDQDWDDEVEVIPLSQWRKKRPRTTI